MDTNPRLQASCPGWPRRPAFVSEKLQIPLVLRQSSGFILGANLQVFLQPAGNKEQKNAEQSLRDIGKKTMAARNAQ